MPSIKSLMIMTEKVKIKLEYNFTEIDVAEITSKLNDKFFCMVAKRYLQHSATLLEGKQWPMKN